MAHLSDSRKEKTKSQMRVALQFSLMFALSVFYSARPAPILCLPALAEEASVTSSEEMAATRNQSSESDDDTKIDTRSNVSINPLAQLPLAFGKKLQELEAHFFGHIYTSEAVERRVIRLERFVFGTESGGPYETRIEHVASTLNVQDPDGTKREINLKPKEAAKPQESEAAQPAIPTIVDSNEEHAGAARQAAVDREEREPPQAKKMASAPTFAPVAESNQPKAKVIVLQVSKDTFTTQGKPGEIIRELDQAIRIHPTDPELMFERAKAWIQMDKFSSALNDLSDAIQNNPNKSDYYIARAWCYKKLGNSYLAADDIKQARFVDPSLPPQIDLLQSSKTLVTGRQEQ